MAARAHGASAGVDYVDENLAAVYAIDDNDDDTPIVRRRPRRHTPAAATASVTSLQGSPSLSDLLALEKWRQQSSGRKLQSLDSDDGMPIDHTATAAKSTEFVTQLSRPLFERRLPFSQFSFCTDNESAACVPITLAVAEVLLLSDDLVSIGNVNSDPIRDAFQRGYAWWKQHVAEQPDDRYIIGTRILRECGAHTFDFREHTGVLWQRGESQLQLAGCKPLAYVLRRVWHRAALHARCVAFTFGGGTFCVFFPKQPQQSDKALVWIIDSHPKSGAEVMCFASADALSCRIMQKCGLHADEIDIELAATKTKHSAVAAARTGKISLEAATTDGVHRNASEAAVVASRQYDAVELTLKGRDKRMREKHTK